MRLTESGMGTIREVMGGMTAVQSLAGCRDNSGSYSEGEGSHWRDLRRREPGLAADQLGSSCSDTGEVWWLPSK